MKLLIKKALIFIPVFLLMFLVASVSSLSRTYYGGEPFTAIQSLLEQPKILVDTFPLKYNTIDMLLGAVTGLLLSLLIYEKRSNRKKFRKGKEHGSARWGNKKDIKPYIDENEQQNVILSASERITMNSRPKDWKTARNKNVLIIGGSGSGKTRNFIKPNIMQMHSSYVITDPKGTILNELGLMLLKNNYKIKIINLINFDKSMRYNPLAYIKDEKDILKLAETIIENTKGEGRDGDDFWIKAEKLLYQALIGAIFYEFPDYECNLNSLMEMLNMSEVRENDDTFKNAVDLWFEDLEKDKPSHFAVKQYKSYKMAAGKTAKSILISCSARLSAFNIPQVADLMSEDEMELDMIGDEKTALFVIIPDTDATFNFIASMMYTQLFNLLITKADDVHGGRLPIHVRCMLDEFANIGKIPQFEKLIATMRSREISSSIVLQTQSQLKAIYKDHTDTIIGNCDTTIFLGGKEEGTLKMINAQLGKETIDDYNTSRTRSQGDSYGQNYSKLGRELMTIDELAVMDRGKCIVQISGVRPFLSNKYDITKHPNYKYHAEGIGDPKWFKPDVYVEHLHNPKTQIMQIKNQIKNQKVNVREIEVPHDISYEGDEVYYSQN